jgi:hypothetical protein
MRNGILWIGKAIPWVKDSILWFAVVIIGAAAVLLVQTGGINERGFTPTATRTAWSTLEVLDVHTPSLAPTGGWFETPLPTSAWVTKTPTKTPRGWVSPTPTPEVETQITEEPK